MEKLMYLKSGTDIRGTALSVNGAEIDLTDARLRAITASFVRFLKMKLKKAELKVTVGFDSRLTSAHISEVVSEVLCSLGVRAFDCSLSSTPSMFMSVINFGVDAAVMITASHLPYEMNGLKFFTREGGFSGEDIKNILEYAESNPYNIEKTCAKPEKLSNMERYCEQLKNMICKGVNAEDYEKPLKGLKIAVDAGNGVGAFYAYSVLAPLGADISGSRFLEPDGNFSNHIPNPENKAAMKAVSDAVKESNSDFGVIFDTDCDRAACVDKNGDEINRNKLVALASYIALNGEKGGVIVTDSVTSDGLRDFIENELGGIHHRFKRGYKNVIDEAKRLTLEGKSVPLAMETSGHAAFCENYYLDDGAYLVTKIIIEAARLLKTGKSVESIIEKLSLPLEEKELRFKILLDDFKDYGNGVINDLRECAEKTDLTKPCTDDREGVRINFEKKYGDGWLLLRMSVHEPLLVLNCESNSLGGTEKMLAFFEEFAKKYEKLDLSSLKNR